MICTNPTSVISMNMQPKFHGLYIANNEQHIMYVKQFPHLLYLDISKIDFKRVGPGNFRSLSTLQSLQFANIYFKILTAHLFDGLHNLKSINFVNTTILVLQTYAFSGLVSLKSLNLSKLNINAINECAFCNMDVLQMLDLSYNNISTLMAGFLMTQTWTEINLTGNALKHIHKNSASPETTIHVDIPRFCCFLRRDLSCKFGKYLPPYDCLKFSRGSNSIYFFSIMVISLILTVNACVLVLHMKSKKLQLYIVPNLALCDGCFVLYFIGILIWNWLASSEDVDVTTNWLKSTPCKTLASLVLISILNSKASSFLIVLRYLHITKYALKKYSFGKKRQIICILLVWLLTIVLSFGYFYSSESLTTLCSPFQIRHSVPHLPTVVNVVLLVLVTTCDGIIVYFYFLIYTCLRTSAVSTGRRSEAAKVFRARGFLSCATYLLSVVGVFTLAFHNALRLSFNNSIHMLLMYVIAIDSLVNPFIYTLSNRLSRMKIKARLICK